MFFNCYSFFSSLSLLYRLFARFDWYFHFLGIENQKCSVPNKTDIIIIIISRANNSMEFNINYAPQIVNGNDFSLTRFWCEGEKSAYFLFSLFVTAWFTFSRRLFAYLISFYLFCSFIYFVLFAILAMLVVMVFAFRIVRF